mgnify:CR=1 FL=1
MRYLALVSFAIPIILHALDGEIERVLSFPVWFFLTLCPGIILSRFKLSWSIARVLGLYLFGLPLFLIYTFTELPFVAELYWFIAILASFFAYQDRHRFKQEIKNILTTELVFLFVFSSFLLINSFHPALYWGEKPMDISLLGYFLRFDYGPIQDPWAFGTSLQYYALGYFSWAMPARLSLMPLEQAYVYTMAAIPALMALASLEFFKVFKAKHRFILSALVPFLGSLGVINSFVNASMAEPMKGFWSATRLFTHNHFAEFPLWSFLFSDLHPHVMAYPIITLTFSLIVVATFNRPQTKEIGAVSISLCLLPWLNAWDFLLIAPLAAITLLSYGKEVMNRAILFASLVIGANALGAFSFLSSTSRNSIFEWSDSSGLYGLVLHFSISVLACLLVTWKNKKLWPMFIYFFLAISFFDHFVFMDRVNTVFKFFTSIGLLLSLFVLLLPVVFPSKWVKGLITFYFVLNLSLIPMLIAPEHFPVKRPSLKGLSFLKYSLPSDAGVIEYLDTIAGTPLLLEYPGNSFDYQASRISSYTGLPILLGWDNHVVLRGKTWKEIMARKQWIQAMYESTDALNIHTQLIEKGVDYIVVGPTEKMHYHQAGLSKFDSYTGFFKLEKTSFQSKLYRVLK